MSNYEMRKKIQKKNYANPCKSIKLVPWARIKKKSITQKDSKKKIVSKREKKGRASLLELTHQTHMLCHEIEITLLKKNMKLILKKYQS